LTFYCFINLGKEQIKGGIPPSEAARELRDHCGNYVGSKGDDAGHCNKIKTVGSNNGATAHHRKLSK
jgi:hypothetical protein